MKAANNISTNNCPQEQQLFLFVENKLDAVLHRQISKHVSECEICSDVVEGIKLSGLNFQSYLFTQKLINKRIDKKISNNKPFFKRVIPYAAVVAFFLTLAPITYLFVNKNQLTHETAMSVEQKADEQLLEPISDDKTIKTQNPNQTQPKDAVKQKLAEENNSNQTNEVKHNTVVIVENINKKQTTDSQDLLVVNETADVSTDDLVLVTNELEVEEEEKNEKLATEIKNDAIVEKESAVKRNLSNTESGHVSDADISFEDAEYGSQTKGVRARNKRHQNKRLKFFEKKRQAQLTEIVVKQEIIIDTTGYYKLSDSTRILWEQTLQHYNQQKYRQCKQLLDSLEKQNFDSTRIKALRFKIQQAQMAE